MHLVVDVVDSDYGEAGAEVRAVFITEIKGEALP